MTFYRWTGKLTQNFQTFFEKKFAKTAKQLFFLKMDRKAKAKFSNIFCEQIRQNDKTVVCSYDQ